VIASLGSRNNGLIPTVGLLFPAILSCSIWFGGAHCQAQDTSTQDAAPQSKSRFAGPTDSGFLLPNGWHLTPAGKQVDTSDLLLNIFPMKDSRRAVVATSGFNEHQLGIVDLDSGEFLSKQVVHQSWFGLAVAPDESRLWCMEGKVPGLVGHVCPNFGVGTGGKGRERDMDLVEVMLAEYQEFIQQGNMPQFIIMSLGEDHTDGTTPGAFTPEACVASNDLALGKLIDAVSHSPLWGQTAIFVIEDDAQNGPDHVDAHRTVCLVASPYTKRGVVDSTQYSTVSLIRTMELILGLEPLSQFDAAAQPMFNAFTTTPDLTPYEKVAPEIDLQAVNQTTAYGADRSLQMDFSEYDRIDDFELNEILWKAVMGQDAPIPPAVRRAIAIRFPTDAK
jgi:hypothetical protein